MRSRSDSGSLDSEVEGGQFSDPVRARGGHRPVNPPHDSGNIAVQHQVAPDAITPDRTVGAIGPADDTADYSSLQGAMSLPRSRVSMMFDDDMDEARGSNQGYHRVVDDTDHM